MFTNWFTRRKRTAPRAKLQLEALEERWVPAHLGVMETLVPPPASHGTWGIETANNIPTHQTPTGATVPHSAREIVIWER
jgi:hypothetical protein